MITTKETEETTKQMNKPIKEIDYKHKHTS